MRVDGAFNLRDLAEAAETSEISIRSGMVYRSGHLTNVSSQGYDQFDALGMKTVYDLRQPEEIAAMPSSWGKGVQVSHLRELYSGEFDNSIMMTWGTDLNLELARERRFVTYRGMPRQFAPLVGHVFRALARVETYPLLIHCMGGKDRTGFVCALILSHLGVSRDLLVKDFMTSSKDAPDIDARTMKKLTDLYHMKDTSAESQKAMMETIPEHLLASLETIDTELGGSQLYLTEAAGVSESELDAVRVNLLSD